MLKLQSSWLSRLRFMPELGRLDACTTHYQLNPRIPGQYKSNGRYQRKHGVRKRRQRILGLLALVLAFRLPTHPHKISIVHTHSADAQSIARRGGRAVFESRGHTQGFRGSQAAATKNRRSKHGGRPPIRPATSPMHDSDDGGDRNLKWGRWLCRCSLARSVT